jgi:HD-GYP domain-containing protein (c-di-GMP phosphodiesterase class II)
METPQEIPLHILDTCELFDELSPQSLGNLKKWVEVDKFNKDEVIMTEGDKGDKLFIVAEGSVEVFQKLDFHINRTIRELKKGQHFGELALLSSENIRSSSVKALEQPTICLTLSLTNFISLIRADPDIALKMSHKFCERDHENLQLLKFDLGNAFKSIIEALGAIAEYKDPETGSHLNRVSAFSRELATALKGKPGFEFNEHFVELFELSSPLHDIGKVGVPDHILLKPGKLTPDEWKIMKQHTVFGAQAIKKILKKFSYPEFLEMGHNIALYHQEFWDGKGYPEGLAGEDIPVEARIMAVADVYDALRSKRPYKEPLTHEIVKKVIIQSKGTHFDPRIVDAFVELETRFEIIFDELSAKTEEE